MVYKFFNKKTSDASASKFAGSGIKNEIKQNQQLANELHKPIIKNFKKEEFILYLNIIFGVLILQICS